MHRAKMWDEIVASWMQSCASAAGGVPPVYADQSRPRESQEEGATYPSFVLEPQSIVVGLRPLLHGYVTKDLRHATVLHLFTARPMQHTVPLAHAHPPAAPPTLANNIAMVARGGGTVADPAQYTERQTC